MQMHVLGCKRVKGVAKATGNDFDMLSLFVRVPIEKGGFGKVQIDGAGFETAEIDLDVSALPAFLALQGLFPLDLELITDQKFHRGEFKTFVIGHAHKVDEKRPLKAAG